MLLAQRVSFNALYTVFFSMALSKHAHVECQLTSGHSVVSLIFMGINFHGINENQFHRYLNW